MKRQRELAELFLKKAVQDMSLLDAILENTGINDEIFGFHAQQAAEKFLKSILAAKAIPFPKTHDLRELRNLLAKENVEIPAVIDALEELTDFAVMFRYDDVRTIIRLDRKAIQHRLQKLRQWSESRVRGNVK
jgi:HEPN domain-containing protein